MCSELFRIPIEWAGIRLFGFGVLLLIWLAVGLLWLVRVGRRSGWGAETWNILLPLVLGALAIVLLPKMFPSGLPIRGYGTMVLAGSLLGLWLATVRARQIGFDPERVMSLAFWMFIAGIAGARLFYVIEYWHSRFQSDSFWTTLKEILNFPQGGLVVYGALIGATIAFGLFCYRQRLPPLALADLIAPSLVAGLALGRIGCFLNGCCYGGVSQEPWAVTFPRDSLPYAEQVQSGRLYGFRLTETEIPAEKSTTEKGKQTAGRAVTVTWVGAHSAAARLGLVVGDQIVRLGNYPVQNLQQAHEVLFGTFRAQAPLEIQTRIGKLIRLPAVAVPARSLPVQPTQLYSAIHAGLLAWFLWSWYPFRHRDGEVFALLITIYPVTRFVLEIIRVDESAVFGTGLSISQNISLVLLAGAAGLWIYLCRQPSVATAHRRR